MPRDKEMIREANVILDMTPHLNSEGSKHEVDTPDIVYGNRL